LATNYTSIDNALKRDYLPILQKQVEKKVKTWDLFSKSKEGIKGRDLYIKMFTRFPQGVGPAAAEALLPTPGSAGYQEAKISVKRNYAVVQFDAMLEKEKNAIVDIIDFEMQAAEESLVKELNFQLAYSDGTQGRSKCITAISGGSGYVMAVGCLNETEGSRSGVDFLYPGMAIDIAGGTPATATIASIDSTSQITTNEQLVTVPDNAVLTRANSANLGMMGLGGIVKATGALQTLNPASAGQEFWKSYEKDMSAKWSTSDGLFLDAIQETIDAIEWNGNGKVNLIYAWPLFQRQYRYAMEAKRRIVNTLDFKEGRSGLAYVTEDGEISIQSDVYLPWFKVYFLDTSKLSIRTLDGLHWEEKDGAILRFLERKDVYVAWMKLYSEFITTMRNAHGYWTNTGTSVGDYS
jgi:hypothetical protein